jgi:D-amino peptidase
MANTTPLDNVQSYAAHFGVPLLMVSGDDAYIEHAQSVLPGVEGVVTKWAHSWTSARMLLPRDVQRQIGTSTTSVLARLDEFNAVPLPDTITVDMRLLSRKGAELLDFLPMIERTDSHSIRFVGKDMVEVSKVLGFLLASGAITPK